MQAFFGFAFTIQQEVQKLRRETSALANSLAQPSEAASVQAGYPSALQRIVATAQTLTAASGAAIALGNETAMTCIARSGAWAPPLGSRFEPRTGLGGECVRTRDSVICMNAAADPRVDYNACMALGIRSMVYRPLFDSGKLIGVLAVFSAKAQHFSYRDLTSLRWTDDLVSEALHSEEDSLLGAGALVRAAMPSAARIEEAEAAPEVMEVISTPAPQTGLIKVPPAGVPPAKLAPTFVGRVVDESVAIPADELPVPSPLEPKADGEYDSPLPMLIATLLVVVFISVVAYMSYRGMAKPAVQTPKTTTTPVAPTKPIELAADADPLLNASPLPNFPSGVTFRSDSSRAVMTIALTQPVTYEGFAIKNPNRVYFDLHGISLTSAEGTAVPVLGPIISKVRISVFKAGTTRIVFDLSGDKAFQVKVTQPAGALAIEVAPKTASEGGITTRPGDATKIISGETQPTP